jgi:hypothetical protein
MLNSSIVQFNASPVIIVISTARRLITGSMPGMPAQMGHTCELGGSPADMTTATRKTS